MKKSTNYTKRDILKGAMNVPYCNETRFDYLDDEERPLIYEAMQQYSDQENKELQEQRDELLNLLLTLPALSDPYMDWEKWEDRKIASLQKINAVGK